MRTDPVWTSLWETVAAASILTTLVVCVLLAWRRRNPSLSVRVCTAAGLVLAGVGSVWGSMTAAEPALAAARQRGLYVHPNPLLFLVPMTLAVSIALLFRRVRSPWNRWLLPGIVLAALVFLNLRNRCQPSWCGDFGFPLVYRHWSDAISDMNGVAYGPWFSARALAADIGIGLATVIATVAASVRRGRGGAHATN